MPRRGINANPDLTPPVTPWYIRNPPTFSMQVDGQNSYYTIITMDASTGDVLGAVMNYPYETQVNPIDGTPLVGKVKGGI